MEIKYENSNSFWNFTVRKFRFTVLLIVTIIILGSLGLYMLPRESSPEVKIPMGVISAIFPSASPNDVETMVTDEIEKAVAELDGIDEMTSTSSNGVSMVIVQFDPKEDLDDAIRNLKDKVNAVQSRLPSDVENVTVSEISFDDIPIVTFSLSGDYELSILKEYAEKMKDEIEVLPEASEAKLIGGQDLEWQVLLDPSKLKGKNISVMQVIDAINSGNSSFPVGTLEINGINYGSRFDSEIENIEDIEKIPVLSIDESQVFIEDLGRVKEGYAQKQSISELSIEGSDLKNAINIEVYKKTGGNVVKLAEKVKNIINEAEESYLPDDIDVDILVDYAYWVDKDLQTLSKSGIQTIILVFIIILLILGFKEALIVGISVPLTFFITFAYLYFTDNTLNSLVLFSLILSLGILVDTSIVIVEFIYENIHAKKMDPYNATITAIEACKWPLIAGTLTTIAAFFPMALMSGIMGEFIRVIPITVSITLLSSLFVALFINTALAAKLIKKKNRKFGKKIEEEVVVEEGTELEKKIALDNSRKGAYIRFLKGLIQRKWMRRLIILILFFAFGLSLMLPVSGKLPVQMFPEVDVTSFYVNIETRSGTVVEETQKYAELVAEELLKYPEIKSFSVNVGSQIGMSMESLGGSVGSTNLASLIVSLYDENERTKKSYEIVNELNTKFENVSGAKITLAAEGAGPPTSEPISVQIFGYDYKVLEDLVHEVEDKIESIDGPVNIENSLSEAAGEFVFTIDRKKASYYGASPAQIATLLMTTVSGYNVTSVSKEGEDINIIVRYNLGKDGKFNNISLSTLSDINIETMKGQVPLSEFVNADLSASYTSVDHLDQKRVVYIKSQLEPGYIAQQVFTELDEKMKDINFPDGYGYEMGGENEEIMESFTDLFYSMIIGIILIMIILVLEFDSFRQTSIILFTFPLSLIGVFNGLYITGQTLSFPAFIGVVALAGVVVNDAILLIDRINVNYRKIGLGLYDSISEAVKMRTKPIFMTTITTIAGVFPLIYSDPMWAPLALSIIFGLAFSTLFTLLIIPIMYTGFEEKKYKRRVIAEVQVKENQ